MAYCLETFTTWGRTFNLEMILSNSILEGTDILMVISYVPPLWFSATLKVRSDALKLLTTVVISPMTEGSIPATTFIELWKLPPDGVSAHLTFWIL